jgi:hypothetical protein
MIGSGPIADWLNAIHQLAPQDTEAREAIARLLGLEWRKSRTSTSRSGSQLPNPKRLGANPSTIPTPETASPDKPRRRIDSVLTPSNAGRDLVPAWLTTAQPLPPTESRHLRPVLPFEPLFPKPTTRAILSTALATPSLTGPIDLNRVLHHVSQARLIESLPRVAAPTLGRGVQLLIDAGEAMQPFAPDMAILRSALLSVLGRDRTEVRYFEFTPLRGCGNGPKDNWPGYAAPAAGTPVVLLTDLAIAHPPDTLGLADSAEWIEFAHLAARSRCPVIALVPYPPHRWPQALARKISVVQWDRATTVSAIRKAIGRALQVQERL